MTVHFLPHIDHTPPATPKCSSATTLLTLLAVAALNSLPTTAFTGALVPPAGKRGPCDLWLSGQAGAFEHLRLLGEKREVHQVLYDGSKRDYEDYVTTNCALPLLIETAAYPPGLEMTPVAYNLTYYNALVTPTTALVLTPREVHCRGSRKRYDALTNDLKNKGEALMGVEREIAGAKRLIEELYTTPLKHCVAVYQADKAQRELAVDTSPADYPHDLSGRPLPAIDPRDPFQTWIQKREEENWLAAVVHFVCGTPALADRRPESCKSDLERIAYRQKVLAQLKPFGVEAYFDLAPAGTPHGLFEDSRYSIGGLPYAKEDYERYVALKAAAKSPALLELPIPEEKEAGISSTLHT